MEIVRAHGYQEVPDLFIVVGERRRLARRHGCLAVQELSFARIVVAIT